VSSSLNKVQLIGNLGRDPEVRRMNNGNDVVSFSIACGETWKDKNTGDRKERTEWVNIVIFNEPLGQIAAKYLKKGSKAYIEGKLRTREYIDNGGTIAMTIAAALVDRRVADQIKTKSADATTTTTKGQAMAEVSARSTMN
jgi:single-strand DNA-binding protein